MLKKIVILFVFSFVARAQTKVDDIQLLFKSNGSAVRLRWAPADANIWLNGLEQGYTIERTTIEKNKKSFKKGIDFVSFQVKPHSKEQWIELAKKSDGSKIIVEYFYNQPIDVKSADPAIQNAVQGRFGICMLVADFYPEVASGQALAFTDSTVKQDEIYSYTVKLNGTTVASKIVAGLSLKIPQQSIEDLVDADFNEKTVVLKWTLPSNTIYSGYHVDRSDDGGVTYKTITKVPYIPVNTDSLGVVTYADSVPQIHRQYHYRVQGIDPFAELGPTSNISSLLTYQTLLPAPDSVMHSFTNMGRVSLTWRYPDSLMRNISGFNLLRTDGTHEPKLVNKKPFTSKIFRIEDEISPLDEVIYYFIDAVDLRGKTFRSEPVSITVIDSIAPFKVQNLLGEIDSSQVARLCWKPNKELDLYKYEVYRADEKDPSRMFLINSVRDTTLTDSLSTIDADKFYYIIKAMDNHFNFSDFSDTLQLVKPDTLPPMRPFFTAINYNDTSLVVNWMPSGSTDVLYYRLYKKNASNGVKTLLFSSTRLQLPNYFVDTTYQYGQEVTYQLEAIDNVGHSSGDACQETVLIEKPLRPRPVRQLSFLNLKRGKGLKLTWQYTTKEKIKTFEVYKQNLSDMSIKKIGDVDGNIFEFIDQEFDDDVPVAYRIMIKFADGAVSLKPDFLPFVKQ